MSFDPRFQNALDLELGLGATVLQQGVHFCVWAPQAIKVDLILRERALPMAREQEGYFTLDSLDAKAGDLYRYRLDDKVDYPDPCSRYQPEGPHGPSQIVDPHFAWTDGAWRGVSMHGQVVYELHIGCFTPEGIFDAAIERLPHLKDLGVTVIEVMPVAEFPGRWNWGYDSVDLYAPFHGYGDPNAFKRFVDAAHAVGLAVILDVVYNHIGPDGNYLHCFSPDYFTDRYDNEWGEAINFDGPNSKPVREFFIRNACYWIREFHLDGLRLDATQSIHDNGPVHVLAELSQRVRAVAQPKAIILIAENEPQNARQLLPIEAGGAGLDAMWNEDFHHSARVACTGKHEGYFHDHRGRAQEFISAVKRGFLFQGQYYDWQKKPRGAAVTIQPANAFVVFTQNHDQVANTLDGARLHQLTSPGRHRAIVALQLLSPQTPMLFMGEEFSASSPFTFFADHKAALRRAVHKGRKEFISQFPSYATPNAQAKVPDPGDETTFRNCKLNFDERQTNQQAYVYYKELLALRRSDPVIAKQDRFAIDGAVLTEKAFVLRWFDAEVGDRLLLVNLGDEADLHPAPEPLLAPPPDRNWSFNWSSEAPHYGGFGAVNPLKEKGWCLPAESAVFFRAEKTQ
ncbi:MAG TPA: malto-oligosyltrehalose trehalohydrolase [Burkholderiales bacterium]|nr:malto-oligosyltrehalose trehalohydrolase [Burkholderiales bacterium]